MTRKHIEWFCIIGNILGLIVLFATGSLIAYINVAGVPNGCMLGMLFVESRNKRKESK